MFLTHNYLGSCFSQQFKGGGVLVARECVRGMHETNVSRDLTRSTICGKQCPIRNKKRIPWPANQRDTTHDIQKHIRIEI